MEEKGYVVVSPDGQIYEFTYSGWRKGCEDKWMKIWGEKETWREYYQQGYRIKRCTMSIELDLT